MALMARRGVVVATDGSGEGSSVSHVLDGWLVHIIARHAATLAITDERGEVIMAATALSAGDRISPRLPVHDAAGAAIAGGYTPVALIGETLTFTVTGGANNSALSFDIITAP